MFLVLLAFLFSFVKKVEATTALYYTPGGGQWTYMTIGQTRQFDLSEDYYRSFVEPQGDGFMMMFIGKDLNLDTVLFTIRPTNGISLEPGGYIGTGRLLENQNDLAFLWGQDSRVVGDSTTWVTILDVEYGPDGIVPTMLAMDFIHFEDTGNQPDVNFEDYRYSFGSFRYNSSIPLTGPVPEPAPLLFMTVATPFFLRRRR